MRFPKHVFAVRTVFRRCFLVNFAVDPAELASVLPAHIEPDVFDGSAYVSVVVGEMDRMRPVGIPRFLGISYRQIVYRAVVRCGDERGVHFLRSDADSWLMSMLGNMMSFFRFHRSKIDIARHDGLMELDVHTRTTPGADIAATFTIGAPASTLPDTSAFTSLEQAKSWLVEVFAAFDYTAGNEFVDIVRIQRGEWSVHVVEDLRARYEFMLAGAPSTRARLDSVFLVGDVPYRWYRLEKQPLGTATDLSV